MSSVRNVTHKLIADHLISGEPRVGSEIALRIDQTLTQDATGTLVMLALEAMELDRVRTEVSAQYVDHNLIQADTKNPDDHLFLASASRRFGLFYSPPGGGVSHPVHMERLGKPGKTLLGSDSHTCAGGSLGMLAMGAGGLDVALAMAGEPYHLKMPAVWGIRLVGQLPPWVSAKDVILELLRRHGVSGGLGRILEYHGPGLDQLAAMDRHVIANMGAELGATTSVFPSDGATRAFLKAEGREADWIEVVADPGARYDLEETVDLSRLEPLIARPSSPANVVPVRDVAGTPIYQAYLGSSANPGFRDFAVAACMVRGRRVSPDVSFDVNPTSRQLLHTLARHGLLADLIAAGARIHQAGCNGCIGMGQAPASGRNSLRTVPRNFPGRSGSSEDSVWLCSPETVTASALSGCITDPRELGPRWFDIPEPKPLRLASELVAPPPAERAREVELVKGPNIVSIPSLEPAARDLTVQVLLSLGDDISTDTILPAGARVLPYRSNIPGIARFCFAPLTSRLGRPYAELAKELKRQGQSHAIVAGRNYGQGSSREHAALAPRFLGLQLVVAESIARIHRANLVNFGVLPLVFADPAERGSIEVGDCLELSTTRIDAGEVAIVVKRKDAWIATITARHDLTTREMDVVRAGGMIRWMRRRLAAAKRAPRPSRSVSLP
jgi:aconitate hydratase